jgi:hypothetical protein
MNGLAEENKKIDATVVDEKGKRLRSSSPSSSKRKEAE